MKVRVYKHYFILENDPGSNVILFHNLSDAITEFKKWVEEIIPDYFYDESYGNKLFAKNLMTEIEMSEETTKEYGDYKGITYDIEHFRFTIWNNEENNYEDNIILSELEIK